MTERTRVAGLVIVTCVAGRLTSRALIYGTWSIDGELLAQLALVPLAQVATLLMVRRFLWRTAWREDIHQRG